MQYLVQSGDLRSNQRFNADPVTDKSPVSFLVPSKSDNHGTVSWSVAQDHPEDKETVKWGEGCFKFSDDTDKMVFVCNDTVSMQIYTARYCSYYEEETPGEKKAEESTAKSFLSKSLSDLWPDIPWGNRVVDIGLGALLFLCLMSTIDFNEFSESLMSKCLSIASFLDDVISWLAAAPVGLKLNPSLGEFLGLFFKYHIYLFKGYLSIISSFVPIVIKAITLTALCGITSFLSYCVSFCVLLMLHVYCFYAYATNLYSAQLKALVSLGRLLAGVKWNPVRQRVDTLHARRDQLILGTLIFSTLLFLFPTTLVYYFVFSLVHVALILFRMLILSIVSFLRTFPFSDLVSILLKHSSAIKDITIQPHPLYTSVFLVQPVYKTFSDCLHRASFTKDYTVSNLRSSLIHGDIIKLKF